MTKNLCLQFEGHDIKLIKHSKPYRQRTAPVVLDSTKNKLLELKDKIVKHLKENTGKLVVILCTNLGAALQISPQWIKG